MDNFICEPYRPGDPWLWVWEKFFCVYKTYEYVLFCIFAESLTATHLGGSEVEGPF